MNICDIVLCAIAILSTNGLLYAEWCHRAHARSRQWTPEHSGVAAPSWGADRLAKQGNAADAAIDLSFI